MSEWLGKLAGSDFGDATRAVPDWLTRFEPDAGFRETALFAAPVVEAPEPAPPPAPEDNAPDLVAEAVAKAFAQGEHAGRAAAEAEAQSRAASQRALRLNFRALDEAALAVLAEDLATTVLMLCDSVLGAAAKDSAGLLARCQMAAERIGGAADALTLHLHPDDMAHVGPEALSGWRIMPDATLEPGALVIEGPEGSVSDGPAEWRRAIAAAVRG